MEELIEYLENKIVQAKELGGMEREIWAFTQAIKKAKDLQLQQGGVSGSFPNQCSCSFNHGTNCFTGNCTACGLRKDNYVKQEKSYSEKDMIESAKYGYEYHATTSFPEKNFENNCKNNFLQHLSAKFGKNYR